MADPFSSRNLAVFSFFAGLFVSVAGAQLFPRRQPPTKSRDTPSSLNELAAMAAACPCVRPTGSSTCVAYNEKYQAATLDEAVMNFADLTAFDPSAAVNIFGQRPDAAAVAGATKAGSLKCKTLECIGCYNMLADRLLQQWGPTEATSLGIVPMKITPQVVGSAGRTPGGTAGLQQQEHCSRLQRSQAMLRKSAPVQSKPAASRPSSTSAARGGSNGQPSTSSNSGGQQTGSSGSSSSHSGSSSSNSGGGSSNSVPDDAAWLILGEMANRFTTQSPDSSSTYSTTTNSSTTSWHNGSYYSNGSTTTSHYSSTASPRRNKRQGGNSPPGTNSGGSLGASTPLDCSYKKGAPLDDGSGYVGLCNLCWSLRTLSSKYFPRYVNELSCDQSDNGCLNGYAKCRERFRSVDVLYNSGTDAAPKWQQYSINSPVACECQILSGSAMHDMFAKGKSP